MKSKILDGKEWSGLIQVDDGSNSKGMMLMRDLLETTE
jgi:hypothetical protein